MPWKNGKGVTIEIAIHPADATIDNFDWRLSTASVDSDGPFSRFDGIERSLAVLEGDGIILTVEGMSEARLTGVSTPLSFAADSPTMARLIGSPITDLNAMSRRGRARHSLSRHEIAGSADLVVTGDDCIIFCGSGAVEIAGQPLGKLECLRLRDASGTALVAHGTGTLYLAAFSAL